MRMLGAASDVGVKRYFRPERRGLRNRTPSPVPFSAETKPRRRAPESILGLLNLRSSLFSSYIMVIYKMLDLSQIEGFEWDDGNSRKSVDKHGVSQAEAEQAFFNEPLLILEDIGHSSRETRLHALGNTDAGRPLHMSFTLRGSGKLIRVISTRTMHRKERLRYEQEA
jgi:uncharacterized protein